MGKTFFDDQPEPESVPKMRDRERNCSSAAPLS
jgi:hypothetical protein